MTTPLRHIKIVDRPGLLIAVFIVGFIGYGLWSFKTLNEIKVGGPVFSRIQLSQKLTDFRFDTIGTLCAQ